MRDCRRGCGREHQRAEGSPTGPHLHTFGPYTLDTAAWRLLRGDSEMRNLDGEFQLLRVFVEHPNRVLSRDDLIERLKGYERSAFDRSIDVRVTRLRRRIEADVTHPAYIRTVRGEGYLFNPLGAVGLMRRERSRPTLCAAICALARVAVHRT